MATTTSPHSSVRADTLRNVPTSQVLLVHSVNTHNHTHIRGFTEELQYCVWDKYYFIIVQRYRDSSRPHTKHTNFCIFMFVQPSSCNINLNHHKLYMLYHSPHIPYPRFIPSLIYHKKTSLNPQPALGQTKLSSAILSMSNSEKMYKKKK